MGEQQEWYEEQRGVPVWEENPQLLEYLKTGVLFVRDGVVVYANSSARRLTGYEAELVGKSLNEIFPREAYPQVDEAITTVCSRPDVPAIHLSDIAYERTHVHLNLHIARLRTQRYCLLMLLLYDLTPLVQALHRSQQAEQRLQSLLSTLPGAVWEYDLRDQRFTFVSDYAQTIAPKEQLDSVLQNVVNLLARVHPEDRPQIEALLEGEWNQDQPIVRRFRFRDKRIPGGWRWLQHHLVVVREEHGEPIALRGVTLDVHEQAEAQYRLNSYTKQLELLIDYGSVFAEARTEEEVWTAGALMVRRGLGFNHISLFLVEDDGKVSKVSIDSEREVLWREATSIRLDATPSRLREVLRGERAYFVSQDALRDVAEVERQAWYQVLGETDLVFSNALVPIRGRTEVIGAIAVDRRDSRQPITNSELSMLRIVGRYMGIALENVRLLKQLTEAEERWKSLLQSLPVVVWEYNLETRRLEFVNQQVEQWLGYSVEEWIANGGFYRQVVHPDDLSLFEKMIQAPQLVESQPIELRLRDRWGSWHYSRSVWNVKKNSRGSLFLQGVTVDTTIQKLAEYETLRLQRLRSLGEMASALAHEFNNALMGILAHAELLLPALRHDSEGHVHLQAILNIAQNAAQIVRRMQQSYKLQMGSLSSAERLHLVELLQEIVEVTRPLWQDLPLREGVRNEVEIVAHDQPVVYANRVELHEVFTNLILNARDAMPQGGKITITISKQGNKAVVEVADPGVGMSAEVRERCMEPFFTTKGEEGSGLGLSVSYQIISRHAGQLRIWSEEGKGTVVTVTLPLAEQTEAFSQEEPISPATSTPATTCILLVEDEELVRSAVQLLLQSEGHEVLAFGSGEEALAHCQSKRVDVAILDLGMPGMDGLTLARHLKAADPSLPIILLTGWGEQVREDSPREIDVVLAKPVRRADLRLAINQVLGRER